MVRLILKYLKPYRAIFVLGSLSKLAEAILELWLPLFMGNIIDVGIKTADKAYIFKMGGNLLIVSVLGVCFALFCQYGAAVASQGTGTNIRNALVKKISAFSYPEIDKFGTSTLINRVSSDVNNVQQAVAFTMRLATRAPFICVGAVIMSLRINVKLTLIFVAIIPLLSLVFYFFITKTSALYLKTQQKLDKTALIVRESLSGVRVIRAFSRKKEEEARFRETAQELRDTNIHVQTLSALTSPITAIIVNAATIAILYFGASFVFRGQLSQGDIFALCSYATQILYALTVVTNLIVMYTKAAASSQRVSEVLATETSISFPQKSIFAESASAEPILEFKDVGFSYNKVENVLSDISVSIDREETLGVVGVTGCGKTSLINLAQRFYDVAFGEIFINGTNIRAYSKKDLRAKISVVPQKAVLFSGTIAENIRWNKKDATEQEILSALKTAQAIDFVMALPDGINTVIQEGGKNFSGGQRQRIAIARALVKKADIIFMDDSLSALDYKTDLMLRKALKSDLPNSSFVIVSQRISSVISADKIIVLAEQGTVAGIGTHAELLASCEEYKAIYQTQFENGAGVKK